MKIAMTASLCCMITGASSTFAQEPYKSAYFPLEVGLRWTYRVTDLKAPQSKADPKRNVVVEVERKEVYVEKKKDKGIETSKEYMGFILKSTSGGKSTLDHVIVLPAGAHRIHVAKTPINPPMLFFKLADLKRGDSWTCDSISGNKTIKGTFTANEDTVMVPFSKDRLRAWLISFNNNKQGNERTEIDYWFAPNVGMVKQRIKGQSHEMLLELERFEEAEKGK